MFSLSTHPLARRCQNQTVKPATQVTQRLPTEPVRVSLNYRTGSGSDLAVATDSNRLVVPKRPGRYRFLFRS